MQWGLPLIALGILLNGNNNNLNSNENVELSSFEINSINQSQSLALNF